MIAVYGKQGPLVITRRQEEIRQELKLKKKVHLQLTRQTTFLKPYFFLLTLTLCLELCVRLA